jgi:hypothetical protein
LIAHPHQHGSVVGTTEHIVQLFDTPDSLGNVVSAFLSEGWRRGDSLLVLARPAHWARVADRLSRRGCPADPAVTAGRLTVFDAATVLARLTRAGRIDPERFQEQVARPVERLAATSAAGLRIYGEVVDLLAEEGDFAGARYLESLWNALGERVRFTLLCGYAAAHFADAQSIPALQAICGAHSRVQKNTSDLLGNWLVGRQPDPHGV